MDTIEEIYARIDPCGDEAKDIRAILVALLGEVRGCVRHFEQYQPGDCECRACDIRARIAKLGNEGT